MNRRLFLGAATASTTILTTAAEAQSNPSRPGRVRVDLNGAWDQKVAGQRVRTVYAPCSSRPIGTYELSREVALPALLAQERAIVHFDAITYFARVFWNGSEMGTMSAYAPYEFDVTAVARERTNQVRLVMADLIPEPGGGGADEIAIGINPGWEGYGGIIRDCWVELRPATWIDNARLAYTLEPQFRAADCQLRTWLRSPSPTSGKLTATVRRGGQPISTMAQEFRTPAGGGEVEMSFRIEDPALWSPDTPDLYDVTVSLEAPAGSDEFRFRTGFRQFRANGSAFELNGRRIWLNGVCRHDIWKDQGFTLTREQMKRDLRDIKALGANHVRLVHYPHHRYIVDLADELGLMVTEEPGFWQVNFNSMPRSQVELGLRLMEKTIRRDWNAPSVVAWLLGNECRLTAAYLREGKALCRRLDPLGRLVSAANDMGMEKAKPLFEAAEMDFFDTHPYTFDIQSLRSIAEYYGNSRPLTFTEWGGKQIGQSPQLMPQTVDMLLALLETNQLAGTSFWSWQDLPEFSRIDREMHDGILESGVVSEGREPRRGMVMELRRLFAGEIAKAPPLHTPPAVLPLRRTPWAPGKRLDAIDLSALTQSPAQRDAWREFEAVVAAYWPKQGYAADQWTRSGGRFGLWRGESLEICGASFSLPAIEGEVRPLVLTAGHPQLEIPVNRPCSRIHVLGHISCPDGYPAQGGGGVEAGALAIVFEDGSAQRIPLRHGHEIARGNMIYKSSRVDPIATAAQRAACFVKDTAREQYQILLFSAPVEKTAIRSLVWRLNAGEQPLVIFAVSAEEA